LLAKSLLAITGGFERVWQWSRLPRWSHPAVAGLLFGALAVPLPYILGIGFEGTLLALNGALESNLLFYLLVAKLVVVCLAISAGFAGGVFGPAIFLGSMLGGLFWVLASSVGLSLSDQGVYATIGMAAFASSVMQTGEHGSFFRWQLARRNINISGGRDISLLMTHRVEQLISSDYVVAEPHMTIGELESLMGVERQRLAIFIDEDSQFAGSVSLSLLIAHAIEHGMDKPAIEASIDVDYSITDMTNIVTAVQKMAERELEFIPVVSSETTARSELLGVVTKSDVLAEHYDVVKRAREEEFGVT